MFKAGQPKHLSSSEQHLHPTSRSTDLINETEDQQYRQEQPSDYSNQLNQAGHLDETNSARRYLSNNSNIITNMELDQNHADSSNERPHKLDLYSIPVFLLELLILIGLLYSAYYVHFEHYQEPYLAGFYCDDLAYRQQFIESKFTQQFLQKQNELTLVALMLVVPVVLVIFCELVNSMFGALKFRQVRAICTCCKLHSITRRSIRFVGAYILGFSIVAIACCVLGFTTGRLRPYFAQECPTAYLRCGPGIQLPPASSRGLSSILNDRANITNPTALPTSDLASGGTTFGIRPASAPISSEIKPLESIPSAPLVSSSKHMRVRRAIAGDSIASVFDRQWIDLNGQNLNDLCRSQIPSSSSSSFGIDDEDSIYRFRQLAMSWPSFPAALFTYTCLYVACYLSYVGTARPTRMISCVLVMIILLIATIFNVQLVKEHYNHWDDVVASAVLALAVVIFTIIVFLNKFRDTHYYERQKLIGKNRVYIHENFKPYAGAPNHYNMEELDANHHGNSNGALQTDGTSELGAPDGSMSNNDLAMRYFQIPRANYRGAPRPSSSINQVR